MNASDTAFFTVRLAAGAKSRPDVFDRMKAAREGLRFLMDQLRQSQDAAPERFRLIDLLSDAVQAHGAAAEQSFYAALLASTGDQQHARQAVALHDEAALLIEALADSEMTDEAWQASLCRLIGHLEDHFKAEEGEIIPLAKTLFGGAQAARLGDKYEQTRSQWIEAFGRVPEETAQPQPVERVEFLDRAGDTAGHRPVQGPAPARRAKPYVRNPSAPGNQGSAGGVSKNPAGKAGALLGAS